MRMQIEIDTGETKKAKAVMKSLAADSKPKRGSVKFATKGSKLSMDIKCDDKVAMRAAVNSNLRVADACLSVIR